MDQEQKKFVENTSSSYLSLKAELLRKKQDLQKASSSSSISSSMILDNLQSSSSSLKLKAKGDLDVEVTNSAKKKKKSDARRSPTPPPTSAVSRADDIAFAKSRAILEAKSKLYDEIMSNNEMKLMAEDDGNEDNDKSFLVDFERKIYETNASSSKVEYVDSFGRTRLVTAEEYEKLRAAERRYSAENISIKTAEDEIERVERLHREQMRSKWEAEMEELRNKTDVHYQDVLFDEKREHGVGYYKFSTDDQRRTEQMATLNELRSNTKVEQAKFHQDQDKRQSGMADRLNKMRMRKAKEMGIRLEGHTPTEPTPTADLSSVDSQELPPKGEHPPTVDKPVSSIEGDADPPRIPVLPEIIKTPVQEVSSSLSVHVLVIGKSFSFVDSSYHSCPTVLLFRHYYVSSTAEFQCALRISFSSEARIENRRRQEYRYFIWIKHIHCPPIVLTWFIPLSCFVVFFFLRSNLICT